MYKVQISLFAFRELSEDAKKRAILKHKNFMESLHMETEADKEEALKDNEVIENIEVNEYLFFLNGEIAQVTKYIETGKTELYLKGEKIEI